MARESLVYRAVVTRGHASTSWGDEDAASMRDARNVKPEDVGI